MNIQECIGGKELDFILSQMAESMDPSVFNDSVAEKAEWSPLQKGGTNFQTHKLVAVQHDRMEFRASLRMVIFSLLFILVGAGVSIAIFLFKEQPFPSDLIGLVFLGAGGAMLYFSTSPVVFDKQKGFFWKGRKAPYESGDQKNLKNCARLGEIYALQLIAEWVTRGEGGSYYSYKINLVLKDASRINVINYVKKSKIREDAKALAEFLGKPLWDAADMKILDKKRLQEMCKRAEDHPEFVDEETRRELEELKERFGIRT
jgi:hypothetical protein